MVNISNFPRALCHSIEGDWEFNLKKRSSLSMARGAYEKAVGIYTCGPFHFCPSPPEGSKRVNADLMRGRGYAKKIKCIAGSDGGAWSFFRKSGREPSPQ